MIRILKASAGSGKTYNLAREYIRLLLVKQDPQAYRHILAVTFTNKATDEMKGRILKELYQLSDNPADSPYFDDFVPAVCPDAERLKQRASEQLNAILHDYSAFAVSTIDRFFQQALRAFSREIGQFSSYQVELDKASLVDESVERILDALTEEDRSLLDWLTESVKSDLEKGKRFSLEPPLKAIALDLKSGDHEEAVRRHGIDEDRAYAKDRLKAVRKECEAVVKAFAGDVAQAAQAVLSVLEKHEVDPADSNRGFLKGLYAYVDADPAAPIDKPTASFREKAPDSTKWFSKAKDKLRLELEKYGCEVLEAENGKEAVMKTLQEKPDGVFLDIVMPEVGGIEALRVLKEVSPEMPVIMLSSAGTPQKLMETLKLGALDFIQKPYTSVQIKKALESIRKKAAGNE